MSDKKDRLYLLDALRGATIISMILFHGMWDLVYLRGVKADWYFGRGAYIWQQSICWTFILLSGLCTAFSKRLIKRGAQILLGAAAVAAVTCVALPDEPILFGVLCLIGCSMIITGAVRWGIRKTGVLKSVGKTGLQIIRACLILLFFLLFLMFRPLSEGYIGFGSKVLMRFPTHLYHGYFMTFLGFFDRRFAFSDYFPILPWLFLYAAGAVLGKLTQEAGVYGKEAGCAALLRFKVPILSEIGRHSLLIYLLHQPFLYVLTMFI